MCLSIYNQYSMDTCVVDISSTLPQYTSATRNEMNIIMIAILFYFLIHIFSYRHRLILAINQQKHDMGKEKIKKTGVKCKKQFLMLIFRIVCIL